MDKLHEHCMELLKLAQDGNTFAEAELICTIKDKYMNRRIGRYLNRNRQADNDDIKQEFLIGVSLAINKASLDIGNPIEYLISQGVYRARTYLRSMIIKGTTQHCGDCGYISRLNYINGKYICKKCGSTNVTTQEVNDLDDGTTMSNIETMEDFEADLIFNSIMDKFEGTLDKSTNVYSLYKLIRGGIREDSEVKNYIKEIATIWKCSQNNVLQVMTKLQNRLLKFADENSLMIKNNKFINKEDNK